MAHSINDKKVKVNSLERKSEAVLIQEENKGKEQNNFQKSTELVV